MEYLEKEIHFIAYAGCPQGRGFDELDDKGIVIGEVSKGTVNLEFIKTSKRNYCIREVDISNLDGYHEIREKYSLQFLKMKEKIIYIKLF